MIPVPNAVRAGGSAFTLTPETPLLAAPQLAGVAGWLRGALGPATGCWLPPGDRRAARTPRGALLLGLDPGLPTEGYRLTVDGEVRIEGGGPAGVFYGAQTLRQLLPPAVYRRAASVESGRCPA